MSVEGPEQAESPGPGEETAAEEDPSLEVRRILQFSALLCSEGEPALGEGCDGAAEHLQPLLHPPAVLPPRLPPPPGRGARPANRPPAPEHDSELDGVPSGGAHEQGPIPPGGAHGHSILSMNVCA